MAKRTHAEERKRKYFSAEGQGLLEDKELWGNETALRGAIHDSRKRERSNEDDVFMSHQRGPITSTFTADWFLREGQGRELLGEWMKKNAIKSQDQRRMLKANSQTFPGQKFLTHQFTFLDPPIFLALKLILPTTSLKPAFLTHQCFRPSLEPPNRGKAKGSRLNFCEGPIAFF